MVIPPDFTRAERVITESGASVTWGGDKAFFNPAVPDAITLPYKSQFPTLQDFYGVAFHELGHFSELKVGWDRKHFHEASQYAMGELVAEMSACFVANAVDIPCSDNLDNHTPYLASWLKAMNNDPKFIFQASSVATKICDYLVEHKLPQTSESETSAEAAA